MSALADGHALETRRHVQRARVHVHAAERAETEDARRGEGDARTAGGERPVARAVLARHQEHRAARGKEHVHEERLILRVDGALEHEVVLGLQHAHDGAQE